MSFHKGNKDTNHYWLTPPNIYNQLNQEFNFDFDPCPYPLPNGFCGLEADWGKSNYVNPPFGSIIINGKKHGPTAWARKAIEENKKGKTVVMMYPIDKWVHYMINAGVEMRSFGDIKWHSTEDNLPGKGIGRYTMGFILK